MRSRATLGMRDRDPAAALAARDKARETRSGAALIVEESIAASIRRAAIDLLARREHSTAELRARLQRRFGAEAPIDTELEQLVAERLLDDARFVDAFVRMHRQRAHGPLRILHELAQRGVEAALAESIVEPRSADWVELASRWRARRFGEALPTGAKEWQRQARQLQSRGFSAEDVRRVMNGYVQE